MTVSFTGTQSGMTSFQKEGFLLMLQELSVTELVHGDCKGSDEQANTIAIVHGVKIFHLFPSNLGPKRARCFHEDFVDVYEYDRGLQFRKEVRDLIVTVEAPMSPLIRNMLIVDASDVLIATPKEHTHTLRSGTWATIRYAWKRKKKVVVIPPIIREEED